MPVSISIEVEIPEIKLQSDVIRRKILDAMRKNTVPEVKRLFRGTTQGWKNPPNWSEKYTDSVDEISATVWASGANKKQYGYVNFGTDPHPITPKRAKLLRFQSGYSASTKPGSLISHANTRFGPFQSYRAVNHPGIKEPREFDKQVAYKIAPQFQDDIRRAIRLF